MATNKKNKKSKTTELKNPRTLSSTAFEELGLKVRKKREEKGLTLASVAEQSGLSLAYVHLIEKGAVNPSIDKIVAVANVLETSASWLVQHMGKGNPNKRAKKAKQKKQQAASKPKQAKDKKATSTEEALATLKAPRLTESSPSPTA